MVKRSTTKRSICVVTTSRADYGLLWSLMHELQLDRNVDLRVVATGMHLSPKYGKTINAVRKDFPKAITIPMLYPSDSELDNTRAVGRGCSRFGNYFSDTTPDLVVLLGDRFELFAPAIAAMLARIPLAHIHGGETTEGAMDEFVRHAITKMSVVHFTTTEQHRRRVIQMGEAPSRVFNVGAPGLDVVNRTRLLSKSALSKALGFSLESPIAVATFHPTTLEKGTAKHQADQMLRALKASPLRAIITQANADSEGDQINRLVETFCRQQPDRFLAVESLGSQRYLSCMKHFDCMVGNSSSGIIEAASFGLPVVNIGDRQRGRARNKNVIDVECNAEQISEGIRRALSPSFRKKIMSTRNIYAGPSDGSIGKRMANLLKNVDLSTSILKKKFYCDPSNDKE